MGSTDQLSEFCELHGSKLPGHWSRTVTDFLGGEKKNKKLKVGIRVVTSGGFKVLLVLFKTNITSLSEWNPEIKV